MSLYTYENDVIRPLGDPRVHVSLNCMVRGCPRLPRSPFSGKVLQKQLEALAIEFFNEKRTHTIHRGVITPKKTTFPFCDLVIGGVPQPGEGTMTIYEFEGVDKYLPDHNGDMYVLCEQYFIKLKGLVKDWLRKREELGLK